MYNNINEELKSMFYNSDVIKEKLSSYSSQIVSSEISPVKAAKNIIDDFKSLMFKL